jgi:hypothetical protein
VIFELGTTMKLDEICTGDMTRLLMKDHAGVTRNIRDIEDIVTTTKCSSMTERFYSIEGRSDDRAV